MKILFWILAILSLPAGAFVSFCSYLAGGLGLSGTVFGEIVCFFGLFALLLCIVCMVIGIVKLCKGKAKQALVLVVVAIAYCGLIIGGFAIDDWAYGMQLDNKFEKMQEELYGVGWDAPPAIEGIPKGYQTVLNQFYVAVRDEWPADMTMDLGSITMPDYYGEASADNIGFALMDLNGDRVDELVIGTVGAGEEGATAIFCVYEDINFSQSPIVSVEGEVYYLHAGKTEDTYRLEFSDREAMWFTLLGEEEGDFDFDYEEGTLDPAGRMTLELIPFSQYK